MKRLLLGLLVWVSIISWNVLPVYADSCPANETNTDFGCIPNSPAGFTQRIYGIGLGFIGGTAVLVIIYGGYLIMTSRGNPDQLQNGKNAVYYSILGVLLALFGYLFVEVITKDVLRIPGFE